MKIDTRVFLNQNEDNPKLKANANVTLDGCFAIRGLAIREGNDNQLFIAMPSRKVGNEYKEDCFPVTREFRDQLNSAVMDAYQLKLDAVQKQAEQAKSQIIANQATTPAQDKSLSGNVPEQAEKIPIEPEPVQNQGMTMAM